MTYALSVLGEDRPGIVADVSECLLDLGFNIEDLTQTILQGEFAAIFIVSGGEPTGLEATLREHLRRRGLSLKVKPVARSERQASALAAWAFVVTTTGPDCPGQIAAFSRVMSSFGCNITNLKAIKREETFSMIFEIDVLSGTDLTDFKSRIDVTAARFGLSSSVQHREIFEAINRI
ncbi:MAG: amino acid-binding protein [Deltaproteobacteria bacterium]|nr:amino acid-binding protein [Deltaproteobacteria bacterium]